MSAAIPRINALIILDSHGKRLVAKYFGAAFPKGVESDSQRGQVRGGGVVVGAA